MRIRTLAAIIFISVLAYADLSADQNKAFSPANDFPRNPLIYLQVTDLPAAIKIWNESNLKEKYLESQNFKELTTRHLGLKLASRWQEFSDAAGIKFDFETIAGLSKGRAALAVYDIGRLDFVFVAPIGDELFAATLLMRNGNAFEMDENEDGVEIYHVKVDADRGRQKQQLLFTYHRGRLILATSETLLTRTLANINGSSRKDRLADEPDFAILNERIAPHLATVWTNQTELNKDYYFKRYWLMGGIGELKNIRSGILDLAVEDGKIVERRDYLLDKSSEENEISRSDRQTAQAHVPANVPFYRLRSAAPSAINDAITEIVSSGTEAVKKQQKESSRYSSIDFDSDQRYDRYARFGEDFDEDINKVDDNKADAALTNEGNADVSKILIETSPKNVLALESPDILSVPLFFESKKAAIFRLASPARFHAEQFESAVERSIRKRLAVSAGTAPFRWESKTAGDRNWRELDLPETAITVTYLLKDDELFIANDANFLQGLITTRNPPADDNSNAAVNEVTVLNLSKTVEIYGDTFKRLIETNDGADFFTGNIGGMLGLCSRCKAIELTITSAGLIQHEEITITAPQE